MGKGQVFIKEFHIPSGSLIFKPIWDLGTELSWGKHHPERLVAPPGLPVGEISFAINQHLLFIPEIRARKPPLIL